MDPSPPGGLDPRFVPELRTLHEFAGELTANALYMQNELPNLPDPPEAKQRIAQVCDELIGLAYDVRKEAGNLEIKLALAPGQELHDPDITNPDPRVTLGLIQAMSDEVLFGRLVPVIKSLDADGGTSGRHPLSYVLVLESGSNMVEAHARAAEAMNRIEAMLPNIASRH